MLRLPQERCSNGVDIYIMELTFYSKGKRKSFNKQGCPPPPSFSSRVLLPSITASHTNFERPPVLAI